jgi:hypothetical protein
MNGESASARSSAVLVIGPASANSENGPPGRSITPRVGLSAHRPQNAAGIRTDPAASVPIAMGPSPAATAAAGPALDPPGVKLGQPGLLVGPCNRLSPKGFQPRDRPAVARFPPPVSRPDGMRRPARLRWVRVAGCLPRLHASGDGEAVRGPSQAQRAGPISERIASAMTRTPSVIRRIGMAPNPRTSQSPLSNCAGSFPSWQ